MTVIVPWNMNCNKGLIATQAKPVCIILHSIKEITSDERKTLNDPGYTRAISRSSQETRIPHNSCLGIVERADSA